MILDLDGLDAQHQQFEAAHFGAVREADDFEARTGARNPDLDEAARLGLERHLAFHKAVDDAGFKLTPRPAA